MAQGPGLRRNRAPTALRGRPPPSRAETAAICRRARTADAPLLPSVLAISPLAILAAERALLDGLRSLLCKRPHAVFPSRATDS